VETGGSSSTGVVCVVNRNAGPCQLCASQTHNGNQRCLAQCIVFELSAVADLRAHSELVEDPLAACCIAVAVARNSGLDIIIVDLSIQHSLDAGLIPHLRICTLLSRFDELGQTYAQDVGGNVVL
jgi:hypothetical protein